MAKQKVRADRDKEFRKQVYAKYNNQCCSVSNMVPKWANASKNTIQGEEINIRCTNVSDINNKTTLKIYRKDGNILNNNDDNILLLCPFHYGVLYHELRTLVKNKEDKRLGIRKQEKQPTILSKEEFESFLLQSAKGNQDHAFMFSFLYYIGPRVNELINTTKDDIKIKDKMVILRAEITKRKKERHVVIPEIFIESLKAYIRKIPNENDKLFDLSKQRVWQLCDIYAKKAGIKKHIHPHTFRHTYATEIYNATGDLKLVQELLGHKSMSTTSIYAHISKEYKNENVNKAFNNK